MAAQALKELSETPFDDLSVARLQRVWSHATDLLVPVTASQRRTLESHFEPQTGRAGVMRVMIPVIGPGGLTASGMFWATLIGSCLGFTFGSGVMWQLSRRSDVRTSEQPKPADAGKPKHGQPIIDDDRRSERNLSP
jgi:hypothetical protein